MPSLSLDTWRAIARYHPLYFWTLNKTPRVMVESKCLEIIKQHSWQGYQSVGRTEIERVVARSEQIAQRLLNFRVGAQPVALNDVLINTTTGLIDLKKAHSESYIQALGLATYTALGMPSVALSDTDNDGIVDTFTATLATALTTVPDIRSLRVSFVSADRVIAQRKDWSIKPVEITAALNGLTYDLTIVGPSRMLAKPVLYEGITPEPISALDPTILTNYVTTILIEQMTVDAAKAIVLQRWNGETSEYGAVIRDAKHGIISIQRDCASCWLSWCRDPYPPRAVINGVFGYPLGLDLDLDTKWQEVISILAACELPASPCPCQEANAWTNYYAEDLALMSDGKMFRQATKTNPLGTKRGHAVAYDELTDQQHASAFLM